jgi:hypothetical protein
MDMMMAMNYETEIRDKTGELRKLRDEVDFLRATNAQQIVDIMKLQEELKQLQSGGAAGTTAVPAAAASPVVDAAAAPSEVAAMSPFRMARAGVETHSGATASEEQDTPLSEHPSLSALPVTAFFATPAIVEPEPSPAGATSPRSQPAGDTHSHVLNLALGSSRVRASSSGKPLVAAAAAPLGPPPAAEEGDAAATVAGSPRRLGELRSTLCFRLGGFDCQPLLLRAYFAYRGESTGFPRRPRLHGR